MFGGEEVPFAMADEDGSARRLDELTLQSIQQEYRSLLATKPEPEDLETASAHPNVSKNRYCNVLPLEDRKSVV